MRSEGRKQIAARAPYATRSRRGPLTRATLRPARRSTTPAAAATKPVAALAGMRPTIDSVRIDVGHIEVHPPRHARAPSASCRSPARAARAADWHDAILYGEAPLADDDDDVVEATPRAEEADASTSRALVTDADAAAHGGARGMVAADDVADAEHGARPSRVVWRALSANLSERLGVLIAREVEGLLLARLRDLTLQDAVL